MTANLNLIKKAEAFGGNVLSLVKSVDLERHGLTGHVARVAIMLDVSGSMKYSKLYEGGDNSQVQKLVDRVMAAGVLFDDNAAIDMFAFHNQGFDIGEVDCVNFKGCVPRVIKETGFSGTSYSEAIKVIRKHYFGSSAPRTTPYNPDGEPPVYMLFITDGAPQDNHRLIKEQIISASHEPMFIQFVALGEDYDPNATVPVKKGGMFGFGGKTVQEPAECPREFEFLGGLDDMNGRHVDNAGFFAIKSPDSLSDEEFFDRMMGEYPEYLQLPEVKKMLGQ